VETEELLKDLFKDEKINKRKKKEKGKVTKIRESAKEFAKRIKFDYQSRREFNIPMEAIGLIKWK